VTEIGPLPSEPESGSGGHRPDDDVESTPMPVASTGDEGGVEPANEAFPADPSAVTDSSTGTSEGSDPSPDSVAPTHAAVPSHIAVPTDSLVPTDDAAANSTDAVATAQAKIDAEHAGVVERAQDPGLLFWLTLAVGWAVIACGIHGMVSNWSGSNPPTILRTVIGLNVANDALVVPALLLIAMACRRFLARWLLVPVEVGLIMTAVVVLYSYPLVGSWGKSSRAGTSRLPWNYAHNLAVVVGVVWMACGLFALWSWSRARAARR
jgi:hypothetical protein